MLLDQSSNQLLKTNFLGRDGFIWWIGQIALPKTSKWEKSDLAAKIADENLYYSRVKVRIFGYHTGNCSELPDDKLPWAHILIPPGQSNGVVKQGISHDYKGGEMVIGFFLDGDDAQQPVIFGSLYKPSFVRPEITPQSIASKLCSEFKAFDPESPSAHNSLGATNPGGKNVGTGVGNVNDPGETKATNKSGIDDVSATSKETIPAAHKIISERIDDKHQTVSICENNAINKILLAVEKLLKKLQNYYQFAGFYYNAVMNKVSNITGEIRAVASLVTGFITGLIKKGMNILFEKISKAINEALSNLIPKPKHAKAASLLDVILNEIYCLFKKLLESLFDLVLDSLFNFVNQAVGAALCAIENFVGQLLNKILNSLDAALQPLLQQINQVIGGALGSVGNILSQAMGILGIIKGLLNCSDSSKLCKPPETYSMAEGVSQGNVDNFNRVMDTLGAGGAAELIGSIGEALGVGDIDLTSGGCDLATKFCGPPRVEILGGGGFGASGNVIVNTLGRIIGVNMSNFGFGYVEPPVISFIDDCNKGQYGRGRAILENQQIVAIVIDDAGEDYLNNIVKVEYGIGDIEQVPTGSNDTGGVGYIPKLDDIYIDSPGYGYDNTTTVSVGGNEYPVTIGPGGSILGVDVSGTSLYTESLPEVEINNTTNGIGAKLMPILKFIRTDSADREIIDSATVITVVDCVQK
jgi:hypothetical protein